MTATRDCWWSPWRDADDVNIVHVDLMPDPDRETGAFALLDDEERARSRRFLSMRARRQFVLCRAALRVILSERLSCANRQLSFGHLEHGKPFATVDDRRAAIGFNVSHSGGHGLIAVAESEWLGVDVEERLPGRDFEGIGSLVYGPTERQSLAHATGIDKVHLFFRVWSMKEALIKALGSGFSLSPSRFEVPGPMLEGARSSLFRFPHAPSDVWKLLDLGEPRFAAALAYRVLSSAPRAAATQGG